MDTMEFTLAKDVRLPRGLKAIRLGVCALLVGGFGGVMTPVLAWVGAAVAVPAVIAGLGWYGRIRALTLVGPQGVSTRVWRTRTLAWAEIKQVQVVDREKVANVRVQRRSRNTGRGMDDRGGKKVACVRLVRHRGRTVELAAPLIVRASQDSRFEDKVRALRSAHAFYTSAAATAAATADPQPVAKAG